MEIHERVEQAMAHCQEMKWDAALDDIIPAIEATARKESQKSKISGREIKCFIRSKYSILERFSCTGLNMSETFFPNITVETDDSKTISNPDVADIIYHCYRNALAHGFKISEKFAFSTPQPPIGVGWSFQFGEGRVHFPTNLVYALIAVVVFSRANRDVVSNTGSWLSLTVGKVVVKFEIGLLWGAEDVVAGFFDKHPAPRITMNFGV